MRTTPLVGRKVWFGPRKLGWGLSPVSLEGWALASIAGLLSIAIKRSERTRCHSRVLLAPFLFTVLLKGTSPGGPRARRAFDEARVDGFVA